MVSKDVQIVNKLGLHWRASGRIARIAWRYANTTIILERTGFQVNAKSPMGLMSIAASRGTWVKVYTNGDDEEEAMKAIEPLLADRFGEEE